MIDFEHFAKLDLRIGKIVEAQLHPNAEKLYILKVDIGDRQIQLVAGIRPFYSQEELLGKLIAVLVNLEPRNIRGVDSEGMLLAAQSKEKMCLLTPEKDINLGSIIR